MTKHSGVFTVYFGVVLVAAGVLAGFGALLLDADAIAARLLGLVPAGFVVLLVGTVASQLAQASNNSDR
jgi:hypothetical protein